MQKRGSQHTRLHWNLFSSELKKKRPRIKYTPSEISPDTKKKLAAAAKEYQSAKFVTDSLLKSLDIEMSSSQETASTDNAVEESQAEILDIDNVFTKYNQTDSIGKRIESEAVVLHNKYLEREVATTEKFVMDMGLSSILDLSHPVKATCSQKKT